jgi:glycosyltransferase involved in cell wall biosynthesis
LWEDPGFVLIEAAIMKTFVFSSDCESGPNEIIKDKFNGILFKNNNESNFIEKFSIFNKLDKKKNRLFLLNNLKISKNLLCLVTTRYLMKF